MNSKHFRILGDCGRTTIPLALRISLNLSSNDILSFRQNGDEIIVRKERLCDNCGEANKRPAVNNNLFAMLDSLSPEQQFNALTHLSLKWAEHNQ